MKQKNLIIYREKKIYLKISMKMSCLITQYIYRINENQINTYYNNYELVKNNKDLLKLLKLKGIHFENSLRNDPLYSEQYEVFRNLL